MAQRRKHGTAPEYRQCIVAMEGSETEPKYFDAVRKKFDLTNVRLLPNRGKGLTPQQLLKRLDKEKREVRLTREKNAITEYWAVFDHEKIPHESLQAIFASAIRKGYRIADSKPCFELWLLLHHGSRVEFKGLEASGDVPACQPAQRHLENVDSSYDKDRKSKYKAWCYMPKLETAIRNAKVLDKTPCERPLHQLGTRVYHLVQCMLE